MSEMSFTEKRLAEFVESLEYRQIPKNVIEKTKYHLLDTIGCIIIGSRASEFKKILSAIMSFRSPVSRTVSGKKDSISCLDVAFLLGSASHEYEFDDLHRASVSHPGAVVIPAALALGKVLHIDGKMLLNSIIAGYEAMIRVALALGKSHYDFWHTTSTSGVFGSAAAASKLLNLDSEGVLNAFGNAGTQASGLWQFKFDGAMSKILHTGRAAQSGLLSALLAKEGFTGARRILEGEKGLLKATSRDCDPRKIYEGLGQSFKILETSIKPYPSCGHTHPAIYAAIRIVSRESFTPLDIQEVLIRTYSTAINIAGVDNPINPYQAKFSLKYCVAVALKEGKVELQHFNNVLLRDASIKELMNKINVSVDPELDKRYPNEWIAAVSIKLKDGRKFEEITKYPDGDPNDETWKREVTNKFVSLTSLYIEESVLKEIINKVQTLESLNDINFLTELFDILR